MRSASTDREELVRRLTELITPILDDCGLELIEMRVSGRIQQPIVRAFIDRVGGVAVDDCSAVSRRLSLKLDNADVIKTSYTLEVSSPGLDRPLVTLADFNRRQGCEVCVHLKGVKKPVIGTIVSIGRELVLQTPTGQTDIAFDKVEKGLLKL